MTPRYLERARKWHNALPNVSAENEFLEGIASLIEDAVAEERERCAAIASHAGVPEIAVAIRKRDEE